MNMLSAKEIRKHGFSSTRWTTKDKMQQYKGLITLYNRDKKIIAGDFAITRKKLGKEVKSLNKDVKQHRLELGNACGGDRQQLRTTLQEKPLLQIACAQLHPDKVLDKVEQENFNKRKLLDRMQHTMKQKSNKLADLKLELALLVDRLRYQELDEIPQDKQAQYVTGLVQDTTLKKEAALACQHTYTAILKICKKDSIYFDSLLIDTLRVDNHIQSHCITQAITVGQLATEYMDDRMRDFRELEKVVKRDMKVREKNIQEARNKLRIMHLYMPYLIKDDVQLNTGKIKVPPLAEDIQLQQDLDNIEKVLNKMRDVMFVTHIEEVAPCMEAQQKQNARLHGLVEKYTKERNRIQKKRDHGAKLLFERTHSLPPGTDKFREARNKMQREIEHQRRRKEKIQDLAFVQNELLAKVRPYLQQMMITCFNIRVPTDKPPVAKPKKPTTELPTKKSKAATQTLAIAPPENIIVDGNEMVTYLVPRLKVLINTAKAPLEDESASTAMKLYEEFSGKVCATIDYQKHEQGDHLELDVHIEDPLVYTYASMKEESAQIVAECDINPDLVPLFTPKKKKKLKLK